MSVVRAFFIACCLLVLAGASPRGRTEEDPHVARLRRPLPAGEAVERLRRAAAADDDATIRRLAAATGPDPFEVAARMLFPYTASGRPSATDREALARFARAASHATGVRAFVEHWLAAEPEAYARERELWGVTARVTMHRNRGDLPAALAAADAAVALLEALEHSHQGPVVRRLRARTLRNLGRTAEAVATLEDVAARAERRGWPALEGVTRLDLAEACRADGRSEERVLAECRRAEPLLAAARDWRHLVDLLGYAAAAEMNLARLPEAEETVYRAMVIAMQAGMEPEVLSSTLNLAEVTERMGRHETASALRRRVFDRSREAGLLDLAAWAAQGLVWSDLAAGRVAAALAYGDWLEDHADEGVRPQTHADTHLVLGDLAAARGRTATAVHHYRSAVEAQRGWGAPGRVFTALSRVLRVEGRSPAGLETLAALRQAAQAAARASDTLPVLREWSCRELAMGRLDEARAIAERAAAFASAHPEDPNAALAPLQRAQVALAERRWSAAVALLEPLQAALPSHDGRRLEFHDSLGNAYAGAGRWEEAVASYRTAVEMQRSRRVGLAVREALPQREDEHVLATRGMDAARAWYASGGGEAALAAAWWFHEMASSRLLASTLREGPGTAGNPPEASSTLERTLTEVERAHDRVVLAVLAGDTDAQLEARGALHEAYEQLARVEARAARQAGGTSQAPDPVPLEAVRAELSAKTALLAYSIGPEGVLGMAVTSEAAHVERLGDTEEVQRLVSRWRQMASAPDGPEARLASHLYDQLLRPFETLITTRPRWIVLPDGALSGVPFDAWTRRSDDGTSERVIAWYTVTYAHAHGLLEALTARQTTRGDGRGVLALGNPAHPDGDPSAGTDWQVVAALGRGGLRMPVLPSSGAEARGVADLYPEGARELLLDRDASRARWLGALERIEHPLDCVHLACHGLVDDRLPSLSGLVFAGGEMLTAERLQGTSVPADLVVLSACQSGGQAVAAGEGLMGLTRAFLRAGATRVVCTTWQVADASTADLMIGFHRARLQEGRGDAEALRRARLDVLRRPDTAHPYHWAGFQLWGPAD